MDPEHSPAAKGSLTLFAAWLLLHEKADDWIRDALRRARETPEDLRGEYQRLLLAVEEEKEALKAVLSEALTNEVRHMGFVHRDEASALRAEVDDLRARLRGFERRLDRLGGAGGEG